MAIWDVLQALWRRWYVLAGALVLGVVASYFAVTAQGVYWSRAEVTFLAPTSAINPNALRTTSSDLIIAAGAVAKRVNGNATWNQMADPAATIVGQGVLDGWSVQLPNHGGQWSRVYPRQVLDVQVSGPTAEVVRERQQTLLDRIDAELAGLQEGVAPTDLITTKVVPARPPVYYMHGDKARALLMVWVLVGAGVLTAIQILEPRAARQPFSGVVEQKQPRARRWRRGRPPRSRRRPHRPAGAVPSPIAAPTVAQASAQGVSSAAGSSPAPAPAPAPAPQAQAQAPRGTPDIIA